MSSAPIGYVYDSAFLDHVNPPGHPERVERLRAVHQLLASTGALLRMENVEAGDVDPALLAAIHTPEHIKAMNAAAGCSGELDGDTYVSPGSIHAAKLAAGGTVEIARRVRRGELAAGVSLVRPPGHHAEASHAMGFCIFNNVALAAQALLDDGAERVAVFDWDVHHGNGTQHSFEADPRMLYLSTHQYPFYPGTGDADEVGRGPGRGATVNVPMPGGCGDAEYLQALDAVILPVLEHFKPEVLLVSAGFDTYVNDPLANMRVTENGFQQMARRVRAAADRLCAGKIVYVLEGGYDLTGLSAGMGACVSDLLDPQAPDPRPAPETPLRRWEESLQRITKIQRDYWSL